MKAVAAKTLTATREMTTTHNVASIAQVQMRVMMTGNVMMQQGLVPMTGTNAMKLMDVAARTFSATRGKLFAYRHT